MAGQNLDDWCVFSMSSKSFKAYFCFCTVYIIHCIQTPCAVILAGMFDLVKSMVNGPARLADALSEGFKAVWPHVTKDNVGHLIVTFLLIEAFPTMAATFRIFVEKNMSYGHPHQSSL